MIPRIIHYCWFGNSEIPDKYLKYIQEWSLIHPSWEIIRWDETNFKDKSFYFNNAIKNRKWANASNYARLVLLNNYGGIYLDTDVKILKPLDSFLINKCFLGFEEGGSGLDTFWVNNAVIGSVKSHPLLKRCIRKIKSDFDGLEQANESSPKLITQVLKKYYNLNKYAPQILDDDIALFDKNTFYPIPWNLAIRVSNYENYITENTVAVHMWGRTWYTRDMMLNIIDELHAWIDIQNLKIIELQKIVDRLSLDN